MLSWTGDPRRDIADVMRLLYMRGIVPVRGGNASIIDRDEGIIYMSPTGIPRSLIKPSDIAIISIDGAILEGDPTSEWRMHLSVYRADGSAKAIVHAHPPSLLALNYKGLVPDPKYLTEVRVNAKCITKAPYKPPGSLELAEIVSKTVRETGCNAIILDRHGALAYSDKSIYHALDLLEALEDLSRIMLYIMRPS